MSSQNKIKVCFFTKYPPIEGGTASRSYWLARGLGDRGVEVHIVTDALEKEWLEKINFEDIEDLHNFQPENVYVHSLDEIKKETDGGEKPLANRLLKTVGESRIAGLGLDVIKRYKCGVIDSYYFFPYGLSAFRLKELTGLPLIARHAGSDIATAVSSRNLHPFFGRVFPEADVIFTHSPRLDFFRELGVQPQKIFSDFIYGVDSRYFNPNIRPVDLKKYGCDLDAGVPVILCMGKIMPSKKIRQLLKAASMVKEDFLLFFAVDGPELPRLKEYAESFPSLREKYFFAGFLPCWDIPALLRASRCLVQLETDFPVAFHFPIQLLEAMAVGTPAFISEEVYRTYKASFPEISGGKNVLVVNPDSADDLNKVLEKIVRDKNFAENIGREAEKIFPKGVFPDSLQKTIELYAELEKDGKSLKKCMEELRSVILRYF